jgi:hypothetical protein
MAAESAVYAQPLQANTCGWPRCAECAALRSFTAKWNAGQIRPRPALTSTWWESAAAAALYARGVNLPRTTGHTSYL